VPLKPKANVEDAKNPMAKKHLKPPKGGWNVFIALKNIITCSQEKPSKNYFLPNAKNKTNFNLS
jgi:hypothetical protein